MVPTPFWTPRICPLAVDVASVLSGPTIVAEWASAIRTELSPGHYAWLSTSRCTSREGHNRAAHFHSETEIRHHRTRRPYYAQKSPFSFLGNVQLMARDGHVIAQLRRRWVRFFTGYDFEFSNGKVYHFPGARSWKSVYSCEGGDESYRLYRHRGYNYPVFQKEKQTAAFTKYPGLPGEGAKYQIRMSRAPTCSW